MQFIGLTLDLARGQSPTDEWLERTLSLALESGYNAVGLYLEHRFAYSSAPWAAAPGSLTPERARRLLAKFGGSGLRIIPFLNTLGHMEGFIRSEGGQWLAEAPGSGSLQICPSRPECVGFVRRLVAEILEVFDDSWVHLGGDETKQLGQCPACAQRAEAIGAAGIYAEHYADLCRWVMARGRRPCLWADMILHHHAGFGGSPLFDPQPAPATQASRDTLDDIPRETVLFDWQYESRPGQSTQFLRKLGFDVVCCPAVHTFDSAWCFVDQTRRNVDEHADDARQGGAAGVCVTTWEFSHFSEHFSTMPVILSAGRRLARSEDWDTAFRRAAETYLIESGLQDRRGARDDAVDVYLRIAELLGRKIPAAAPFLNEGTWRRLRECFVFRQNPFQLWMHWRNEACGPAGDHVLGLCSEATAAAETHPRLADMFELPILLHQTAVEWVRLVERAHSRYAARDLPGCAKELQLGPGLLNRMKPALERIAASGGSRSDVHLLDRLAQRVRTVTAAVAALPNEPGGAAAFLPAFEAIIDDRYVPEDQACWRAVADYPKLR